MSVFPNKRSIARTQASLAQNKQRSLRLVTPFHDVIHKHTPSVRCPLEHTKIELPQRRRRSDESGGVQSAGVTPVSAPSQPSSRPTAGLVTGSRRTQHCRGTGRAQGQAWAQACGPRPAGLPSAGGVVTRSPQTGWGRRAKPTKRQQRVMLSYVVLPTRTERGWLSVWPIVPDM